MSIEKIKYGSAFEQCQIQIRAHDDITRVRDYYNMHHDGLMTLTENGSLNVLMNQCNKTNGIKNQMDYLSD